MLSPPGSTTKIATRQTPEQITPETIPDAMPANYGKLTTGVPWLHVRLDDSPKYYGYGPYRKGPGPTTEFVGKGMLVKTPLGGVKVFRDDRSTRSEKRELPACFGPKNFQKFFAE